MNDNEKLIEEAAQAIAFAPPLDDAASEARRDAEIAWAVFEKAHTPTDDEREALDYAIRVPIAARHLDYKPLWELIRAIQDSVLAAGFRRSEVPEPSADWYDTHCPTCDAPEPWHTATCAVVHVKVPEQGEPSDAQVLAALNAYYAPDGYLGRALSHWSEGSVRAMRAALKAADGGVR